MKRSFNISVKRSKDYQSVEVSLGFEGEMTEQEYLQNVLATTQATKERAEQELNNINNKEIKLNL